MIEGLKELGKTVLLTTHYMDEAEHLADRLLILRAGEVVAAGTAEELVRDLQQSAVVSFRIPEGVERPRSDRQPASRSVSPARSRRSRRDLPQRELYRLTRWAEERGVELGELAVKRPTLEEVFLEVTKDGSS